MYTLRISTVACKFMSPASTPGVHSKWSIVCGIAQVSTAGFSIPQFHVTHLTGHSKVMSAAETTDDGRKARVTFKPFREHGPVFEALRVQRFSDHNYGRRREARRRLNAINTVSRHNSKRIANGARTGNNISFRRAQRGACRSPSSGAKTRNVWTPTDFNDLKLTHPLFDECSQAARS